MLCYMLGFHTAFCKRAQTKTDGANLHPFSSAAHRVSEDEEEDQSHRRGNRQCDKEVGEVVPAFQRFGGRVVLPKVRQDPSARVWTVTVYRDYLGDIDLKKVKYKTLFKG